VFCVTASLVRSRNAARCQRGYNVAAAARQTIVIVVVQGRRVHTLLFSAFIFENSWPGNVPGLRPISQLGVVDVEGKDMLVLDGAGHILDIRVNAQNWPASQHGCVST
jgi:hypothetical protein